MFKYIAFLCFFINIFRTTIINGNKFISEDRYDDGIKACSISGSIRQYRRRVKTESGTQNVGFANVERMDGQTAASAEYRDIVYHYVST